MKGTKNCVGQRGRLTAALMKGRPRAKGPRNTEESEVMNRVKALQGQLMMEFKRNHINTSTSHFVPTVGLEGDQFHPGCGEASV